MMIPLLVLWWAKAPMRFANGRYRINILRTLAAATVWWSLFPPHVAIRPAMADNAAITDELASGDRPSVAGNSLAAEPFGGDRAAKMIRHREGTHLHAAAGKIFRSGRRWMFRTDRNDRPAMDQNKVGGSGAGGSGAAKRSAEPATAAMEKRTDNANDPAAGAIPLTENLMLQRIVDAIAEDKSDVHWTVSGDWTEFADRNFLTLRSVIRTRGPAVSIAE